MRRGVALAWCRRCARARAALRAQYATHRRGPTQHTGRRRPRDARRGHRGVRRLQGVARAARGQARGAREGWRTYLLFRRHLSRRAQGCSGNERGGHPCTLAAPSLPQQRCRPSHLIALPGQCPTAPPPFTLRHSQGQRLVRRGDGGQRGGQALVAVRPRQGTDASRGCTVPMYLLTPRPAAPITLPTPPQRHGRRGAQPRRGGLADSRRGRPRVFGAAGVSWCVRRCCCC